MSDEERLNLARALGHLEGRMGAMEKREAARDDAIAKIDAKLDAIMDTLSQRAGGMKAWVTIGAFATMATAAGWEIWSYFQK